MLDAGRTKRICEISQHDRNLGKHQAHYDGGPRACHQILFLHVTSREAAKKPSDLMGCRVREHEFGAIWRLKATTTPAFSPKAKVAGNVVHPFLCFLICDSPIAVDNRHLGR
jgi:hypothetical protein